MLNVPNALTLLRLALIPAFAWLLLRHDYGLALPVFLVAALSDLADGWIARRYHLESRLGAALDPVADKLNMLVATLLLAADGLLPLWLAAAIVLRDIVIVAGALAWRAAFGHIDIRPLWLSKLNTALEFATLLLVMAAAARWIPGGGWLLALFLVTFLSVLLSGFQYVWVYGRKALAARRNSGQS
jgi:cardiolipin synthase